MSNYRRSALRATMAAYLKYSPEEMDEIDAELATVIVALHHSKPGEYEELMSRAPAMIRGFADRALAGNVHGV